MHALSVLNAFPSFVKIHVNSKCFVVAGAGAFHDLMFMIKWFLLCWVEAPWCFDGIRDGLLLLLPF
jgi:hypothetical protein